MFSVLKIMVQDNTDTAIRIKSVKRPQPGVKGGGIKKYYASPVHDREISLDGLTKSRELYLPPAVNYAKCFITPNLQRYNEATRNEWLLIFFEWLLVCNGIVNGNNTVRR